MYVMTPEYGAASQLEKIDMLDFAEFVAINKFDRKGAADALRDVAKQVQRNREAFKQRPDEMPVFGTMASRFNDDGVTALYQAIAAATGRIRAAADGPVGCPRCRRATAPTRRRWYRRRGCATWPTSPTRCAATSDARASRRRWRARSSSCARPPGCWPTASPTSRAPPKPRSTSRSKREAKLDAGAKKVLAMWPDMQRAYAGDEYVVKIRDKEIRTALTSTSLSGTKIRKVVLPSYEDHGELLKWLLLENVPGSFPYTAGVFAFKREGEDPARMFAGEGDAFRTNRRFKLVSEGMPAKRLSTAFDSVTLYGHDPDLRPDIYGKVGNSGVSIATLDDMKVLYSGFDLCSPATSVSMTINGPAPTILAMFMNTAIDQQLDRFKVRQRPRADRHRGRTRSAPGCWPTCAARCRPTS